MMKKDYCVMCGSENLKKAKRKIEFKISNPGKIEIEQRCTECQECGDTYYNKKEIKELSDKLKIEIEKIRDEI
jgi:YgiT-type zinc finger domain-containing protein